MPPSLALDKTTLLIWLESIVRETVREQQIIAAAKSAEAAPGPALQEAATRKQ